MRRLAVLRSDRADDAIATVKAKPGSGETLAQRLSCSILQIFFAPLAHTVHLPADQPDDRDRAWRHEPPLRVPSRFPDRTFHARPGAAYGPGVSTWGVE